MGKNHLRTIVESELFSKQLAELGDLPRLDDAINAVYWALSRNPEVYQVVGGTQRLRLLKTDGFTFPDGRTLPPLMVWFVLENDDATLLLSIEVNSLEYDFFEGESS